MSSVYTTTACLCLLLSCAVAFSPSNTLVSHASARSLQTFDCAGTRAPRYSTQLHNLFPKDDFDKDDFLDDDDDDDDLEKYDPAIAMQIRKARQLLSDAKRKQRAQEEAAAKAAEVEADGEETEEAEYKSKLPFFATKSFTSSASRNAQKIKSKTKTGEIIADGETMASLSKSEPWERRSLSQMFEREARQDYDGNTVEGPEIDGSILADRDIVRSMYNLRKSLHNEDFKKVFDSRNRYIGEVD